MLNHTVRFAFENSALYQRLYKRFPRILSLADFQALPPMTERIIRKHAEGLLDCLSAPRLWGRDGILDAVSPLTYRPKEFPFTTVENAFDFNRRYSRVHGILADTGVTSNERLLVVCDEANLYFASDLEDVLTKWEVSILIRDHLSAYALLTLLRQLQPQAVLLVTRRPFGHQLIPPSCRSVLTFMGRHSFPRAKNCRLGDVYTRSFFPWMAARREQDPFFRTNEVFLGGDQPQIFLECDDRKRMLVTALVSENGAPLVPLVRFATEDKVTRIVGSRFRLLK